MGLAERVASTMAQTLYFSDVNEDVHLVSRAEVFNKAQKTIKKVTRRGIVNVKTKLTSSINKILTIKP